MSLAGAYGDLCVRFRAMHAAFERLDAELGADEPLHTLAQQLLGVLDEGLAAAQRGQRAAAEPVNLDRVTAMLPRCQQRFNAVLAEFRTGMAAPERLQALEESGRARVVYAVGYCQKPLYDAGWALSACWRELAAYTRRARGADE